MWHSGPDGAQSQAGREADACSYVYGQERNRQCDRVKYIRLHNSSKIFLIRRRIGASRQMETYETVIWPGRVFSRHSSVMSPITVHRHMT